MSEETNVELMDEEDFFDPADFDLSEESDDQIDEPELVEEAQSEENTPEPTEPAEDAPEAQEQPVETKPELFDLKFLGETRQYTREQMTELAQKGMNHDRILQQRNELQQFRTENEPLLGDLDRLSKLYGVSPAEFLASMERNMLRGRGMTDAEADATIAKEKANRELEAYRRQDAERQRQANIQQRQQADINAFVKKYPDMDYSTIPQEVWADVRKGDTLVNAYGRYEAEQLRAENQRLQSQLATQAKNEKNKQNAIGSMKSGSGIIKLDAFMEGFDEAD